MDLLGSKILKDILLLPSYTKDVQTELASEAGFSHSSVGH